MSSQCFTFMKVTIRSKSVRTVCTIKLDPNKTKNKHYNKIVFFFFFLFFLFLFFCLFVFCFFFVFFFFHKLSGFPSLYHVKLIRVTQLFWERATPSQQCRSRSESKTNLTPLNFQMILSNGSLQRRFGDFGKQCRP